ncbi:MAG TPA: helix-turn-helix domain-containing protein, partial [Kofleriaceae bacterium]|nr:helix-turn-helix domain-containing protein [Kofleriaceae bacterium]
MLHEASTSRSTPAAASKATPRARRRDANLGRILDAAARLVADEGLDALSMARLADAVDYTPGALYRYVDSKDALLSLLVQRILDDLRGALAAAVTSPMGALERLVAMVRAYRAFVAGAPHRFGVLAIALATPRVLLASPAHGEPATAAVVATLRPIADALAAAVTAGELGPGDPVERTLTLF